MRALDLGLRQVAGVAQVGATQRGSAQLRMLEIGVVEFRVGQVGAAQIGPLQPGMRQVRLDENCGREVGLDERCLLQVGPAQLGLAQIDGAALDGTELPGADRQAEVVQLRHSLRILASPSVPSPGAFLQLCGVARISHTRILAKPTLRGPPSSRGVCHRMPSDLTIEKRCTLSSPYRATAAPEASSITVICLIVCALNTSDPTCARRRTD